MTQPVSPVSTVADYDDVTFSADVLQATIQD